jgi:hypothetical protein
MSRYYVNRNAQPNGDHEVHTPDCEHFPASENALYLGAFASCFDAVAASKRQYQWQSNGCYYCSHACHTQ